MSAFEKVAVSAAEGQLLVEVWLIQDAEFRSDLADYESAVEQRTAGIHQPATVRMGEWWVKASTSDGSELSVMRQRSGGSGTEGLMEWILWPLPHKPVNLSISRRGEQVWSIVGLVPPALERSRPMSDASLRSSQPMSDRGQRP